MLISFKTHFILVNLKPKLKHFCIYCQPATPLVDFSQHLSDGNHTGIFSWIFVQLITLAYTDASFADHTRFSLGDHRGLPIELRTCQPVLANTLQATQLSPDQRAGHRGSRRPSATMVCATTKSGWRHHTVALVPGEQPHRRGGASCVATETPLMYRHRAPRRPEVVPP